jgi:hypothetical protein
MLSHSIIQEIQRLLAAGYSKRQTARLTKVSRNTVNHIAAGVRRDRPDPQETALSSLRRQKPKRCGTCGGLVYAPCKLCRLRAKLLQA